MGGRDDDFRKHILAGGKTMGGDGMRIPEMPRSSTQVVLRSTQLDFIVMTDEGKVLGYQITLTDLPNLTSYVLRFGQDLLDNLREQLTEVPDVGTEVPSESD